MLVTYHLHATLRISGAGAPERRNKDSWTLGLGLLDLHLLLRDHLDLLDRLDLLEHLGLLVHREAGRRLGIRGPRRSTQRGARAHVKC